ncbi:MAG: uracil-DNA glycosylase, partial [Candidatus Paceibacterota bacterium]
EQLEKLKKEIQTDKKLPLQSTNLVFGEGNPDADILFIGEAPGAKEDELQRPFVGRSGKLLDKFIEAVGWRREEVYITNIVKRRPPKNRDPKPEEIEKYRPYLKKQIEIINPKIIAPLGRFSMNYFIPDRMISKSQGKMFFKEDRLIIPIYHPAAGLRSTTVLGEIKKSFKVLKNVVDNFDEVMNDKIDNIEKV